jgi:hypothetical protein
MRKLLLAAATFLTVGSGVAAADRTDATITIVNDSDWAIHQLYLSPTSRSEWGPDRLGGGTILPNGGTFLLHDVPCRSYDVKLVDADGAPCIVGAVNLCADDDVWHVTTDRLLRCEGFGH